MSSTGVTQYGFFFDQSRCNGCRACVIACLDWNNIAPGPSKLARVFEWEKGAFPNTRIHYLFAPCYHCANAVCVPAANGAMYKEPKYGAVLIDPTKANSPELKAAWDACPYGAISFDSDSPTSTAYKCTMCIDRLSQGQNPICVDACTMRALDFGKMSDMTAKYGNNMQLEDMPAPTTTPSIAFKPHASKKSLVSYDANAALALLQPRPTGLPPFFNTSTDVTQVPAGLVGRSTLKMKPASTQEFLYNTQHDEG